MELLLCVAVVACVVGLAVLTELKPPTKPKCPPDLHSRLADYAARCNEDTIACYECGKKLKAQLAGETLGEFLARRGVKL